MRLEGAQPRRGASTSLRAAARFPTRQQPPRQHPIEKLKGLATPGTLVVGEGARVPETRGEG